MKKLLLSVMICLLTACASSSPTSAPAISDPTVQASAKLVVEYATAKYLEKAGDKCSVKKERIRAIVYEAREFAKGAQGVTITLLRGAIMAELAKYGLSPADMVLAQGLVEMIATELQSRVGTGALDPSQLIVVGTALDWVLEGLNFAPC